MNTRTSGFRRCSFHTVLWLALVAFAAACQLPQITSHAPPSPVTQNRLSAGSVSSQAGQTVAVPIMINTGTHNVAFFAVTFAVVARNGAPAITNKLSYQAVAGVSAPDLSAALQAQAKLAIGYVGVTISPPLSGTVRVGSLMVPIPPGAKGSYTVELSRISAGDSKGHRVPLAGQGGTITLRAGS